MPSSLSIIFPPHPGFTEKDLWDLHGKVYIVTGSSSGVGLELARILYGANATVYVAARSTAKIDKAIQSIKTTHPTSRGKVEPLFLDLADLPTIRSTVDEFLRKETRLDVLFNNGGVMTPPAGSITKQGYDLEMGTNCLGHYLLTKLLVTILTRTAASSPANSIRVVWVSSVFVMNVAEGGIIFDEQTGAPTILKSPMNHYMQSKVGDTYLAAEMGKELIHDGVVSVSLHPGLMKTELQRHGPAIAEWMMKAFLKGPRYGAYTELFAGLSPKVTTEHQGTYMLPWGRFGEVPDHIVDGMKTKEEGGNGKAARFRAWCEAETGAYA